MNGDIADMVLKRFETVGKRLVRRQRAWERFAEDGTELLAACRCRPRQSPRRRHQVAGGGLGRGDLDR